MRKLLLSLMAVIMIMLSSCGNNTEPEAAAEQSYVNGFCMTENEIFYAGESTLYYYDCKTGSSGVLCSKPDCSHAQFSSTDNPDPSCSAVTPDGSYYSAVLYHNGKILALADNTAVTKLYEYDYKNDVKKELDEFDFLVSGNVWITEDKLIMTVHSIVYDESGAFGDTNGTTYNFCIYDLDSKTKTMTDLPKGTYINRCFSDGEKIYYGAYINDGTLKASTHCYDISVKTDHVILPGNAIFLFDNGVGYYEADGSGKMYSADLKSGETKYLGQGFMNQAFCGMVLYYDGGGYSIYDTASGESKKREDIKGTVLAADGRHILFRGEDGELGAVDI